MMDYSNSSLALIASVLRYFGVDCPYRTLPAADRLFSDTPRNVVLMLFDGLGCNLLEKHLPEDAFLRQNLEPVLSAVFPPTPTAATTTLECGVPPIAHGWLGWNLRFDKKVCAEKWIVPAYPGMNGDLWQPDGAVINLFPNTFAYTEGQKADKNRHIARSQMPTQTVFDRINAVGAARAEMISPFNAYAAKTIPSLCAALETLTQEEGRHYLYTYHNQPDHDIHDYGTDDARIGVLVRQINDAAAHLADILPDTLLLITADHGLTDTAWVPLAAHPELTSLLTCPPSVETRAMSLFVKDGCQTLFSERFNAAFGDIYTLYSHDEVLSGHLFGEGNAHPMTPSFIGDFLAVAKTDVSIDPAPDPDPDPFRAAHGGMTRAELEIPLIAYDTRRNR